MLFKIYLLKLLIVYMLFLGWGVISDTVIDQGNFIVEYSGDLLEVEPNSDMEYVYEFSYNSKVYW